jgi:hypothetical protein
MGEIRNPLLGFHDYRLVEPSLFSATCRFHTDPNLPKRIRTGRPPILRARSQGSLHEAGRV